MKIKEIISGLKFTVEMFLLNPSTGERTTKEQLNDMDRTTVDACEGAIDLLQKYHQWIPVSERLPDVGRILISDGNQVLIGGYHGNNTWSIDGCEYDPILENIAWMPLPEPWKEEQNDH